MKSLENIFGPNTALVEELYNQYLEDPESVPEYWRQYFDNMNGRPDPIGQTADKEQTSGHADDRGQQDGAPRPASGASDEQATDDATTVAPARGKKEGKQPSEAPQAGLKQKEPKKDKEKEAEAAGTEDTYIKLKGVGSKVVENMEESLEIPTATSLRVLPVKMMMENRKIINRHLERNADPKATMTHFIAWAIVRALEEHPTINSYYTRHDGQSYRVQRSQINLGVAVDLPTKDGGRSLVVPNIKGVDQMDFKTFLFAYHELIDKARNGKLDVADFQDTTISITNPGTIGTVSSMPRLMKEQGAILATGAINYPAEFQSMSQEVLNHLGISQVMSMTCTYDHRIIQGAESGSFLARVSQLLNGEADFYDKIFANLDIPYDPLPLSTDNYTGFLHGATATLEANKKAVAVMQLIDMYRRRGHLLADVNPLNSQPDHFPELDLEYYGLTMWDLDREFYCGDLAGYENETAPLRDIIQVLRDTYCGHIGAEYSHILDIDERNWLRDKMESTANHPNLDKSLKKQILHKLNQASAFEEFLHKKYIGHKRFSLEGAETLIPMLDYMLERFSEQQVKEVLFGMAHRGRLNVLVNTLGKSFPKIFAEFEGNIDPDTFQGSGDVKYHLGAFGEHRTREGRQIKLQLMPNPSHLESVNPVVEGATRAKQDMDGDPESRKHYVPLLIHGDAAFAGQGVVTETLNMSQHRGYHTGGTIHIIINNQIGFTTLPKDGRSTEYASDVSKAILAPIFHVNGDDPESAIHTMKLALEYRQKFNKDVIIDLVCYRKHGHNEGDEPAFTQPGLYKEIKNHPSVRERYTNELVKKNELTQEEVDQIFKEFHELLEAAFEEAKQAPNMKLTDKHIQRKDTPQDERSPQPDTRYDTEHLKEIARKLNTLPQDFDANPKLLRILAKRAEIVNNNEKKIDWGFAEALSFGSLLEEQIPVRLAGQDSERGTFSQRHSVLHGTDSDQKFVPLNNLSEEQATYYVYNSILSEFAAMGFEFGYSTANLDALVLWEAQFGDFFNGAQVVIDQYISSCEAKWGQKTAVTLLLPHGFEGQGPEHSSARLERFLQLCAEDNMVVTNPTTPAQYFHLLRLQALQSRKKPLIVMTPKSLLRHTRAVSNTEELANGRFNLLLPDESEADPANTERLILCSGKVYYDLVEYREQQGNSGTAIARLEQLYPFPDKDMSDLLQTYGKVKDIIWCQEEPQNMGGWTYVNPRINSLLGKGQQLRYIGRAASASPATGSAKLHEAEQEKLVREAFGE